ncbi:MAG: tetratricopeptide repeat protein [Candidatus Hydrogenedentes bacterium]|nr:tetratricopeptide repeat protein [Candidatus Hydrogenedentota bacterium]
MFYSDRDFESLYDEGLTALMRGDLTSAETLFKEALEFKKDSHLVYYQLGRCYIRKGDIRKAEEMFKESLKFQSVHVPTLAELGFIYLLYGDAVKAREFFEKSLNIRPSHSKSLIGVSACEFTMGNWDSAYEWATKSVELGGSHFMALLILGKCAKVLGFVEKSEEILQKAEDLMGKSAEVSPDQPETYFLRGEIALLQGKFSKALEFFKETEKHLSGENRTYYFYHESFNLAVVLAKQLICLKHLEKREDAKKLAEKILSIEPDNKLAKSTLERSE